MIVHLGMNPNSGWRPPIEHRVMSMKFVIMNILSHVCKHTYICKILVCCYFSFRRWPDINSLKNGKVFLFYLLFYASIQSTNCNRWYF